MTHRDSQRPRAVVALVGPGYMVGEAYELADRHGWTVKPDGERWRRVVPSPESRRIVQLDAIERLVDASFIVV